MFCSALLWRCANTTAPQGGPRDSLPPLVTSMNPAIGQTSFKDKKIFIEFNEYIQIKDQMTEFFVSPRMKKNPALTVRGRGVQISITDDSLRENQTYALNFGSAIRDNNEGNVLYGLRYVFSTGESIDSMLMSGYVADGKTGDSASNSLLYFYDALYDSIPEYDSLMLKREPDAIARAEKNGIFVAQNLKPIPYKVYAVQDKNKNNTYEPGTDKVGFLDEPVNPADLDGFAYWVDSLRHYPTADPQIYIRLFTDNAFKRQYMSASERPGRHQAVLRFGAEHPDIKSIVFDSVPSDSVVWEYKSHRRDTLTLWFKMPPRLLPDTIKGTITYMKHDSLSVLQPVQEPLRLAWKYFESKEEKKQREQNEKERVAAEQAGEEYIPPKVPNPFGFKVDASAEVNPEKNIPMEFTMPLIECDSAAIVLLRSVTEGRNKIEDEPVPVTFRRDTANMHRWVLSAEWQKDSKYKLMIPAGAFVNVARQKNDTLRAEFSILDPSKYATVYVNVTGKTPEAEYILSLREKSGKVIKEVAHARTGIYKFIYVPEGEVQLRVTEDLNANGLWDTGRVIERRQPERVETYTSAAGDSSVPTKANWDVNIDVDMAKLFEPVSIENVIRKLELAEQVRVSKLIEEHNRKVAEAKARGNQEDGTSGGGLGIGGAMSSAKSKLTSVANMTK